MTNTAADTGSTPAPIGLLGRVVGIITAPGETFKSVVAHPRWFGMLALTLLTTATLTGGFMFTEAGQNAWLDQMVAQGIPPEQMPAMERMAESGIAAYMTIGGILVAAPIVLVIVAGIIFAVFNAGMGGNATFRQVFAVCVHTGAIGLLAQFVTVPLNYVRESLTSSTSLAVMLPMLEEQSFGAKLAAGIDLFVIWQLIVLSIGLGVLYRRKTQPIAISVLTLYLVIVAAIAAITAK